jgi:hypothetical protein
VLVGGAGLVGVLDAQQEGPTRVSGVEPVEERGAGAADVEVARGGRGEADADRRGYGQRMINVECSMFNVECELVILHSTLDIL